MMSFVISPVYAQQADTSNIVPQQDSSWWGMKLIPQPQQIDTLHHCDYFQFTQKNNQFEEVMDVAIQQKASNFKGKKVSGKKVAHLPPEGYHLLILKKEIHVMYADIQGLRYAKQTLTQLRDLSPDQKVPCMAITDYPRFPYRGLHLDVSRHFFQGDFLYKYAAMAAQYRFNVIHLHLTDDQGWRFESKFYPKLNTVSSKRSGTQVGPYSQQKFDTLTYRGSYTQEFLKGYAQFCYLNYGITVIPEIEMPGHSQALLAAYPQFGCNPDKMYEVRTKWGVSEDVLCPREETFQFVEDVLTEVMELFPGQYIHIGGDECPKTQWKESRFCQNLIKQLGLKDEHELQS